MKTMISLRRLLESKGYELEFERYNYWNNVPVAVKKCETLEGKTNELKVYLIFTIMNLDYRNETIDEILPYNLTKKEISNYLDYIEKNFKNSFFYYDYNNRVFGHIAIINGKVKRDNYYKECE